jgi:hypothetical protein
MFCENHAPYKLAFFRSVFLPRFLNLLSILPTRVSFGHACSQRIDGIFKTPQVFAGRFGRHSHQFAQCSRAEQFGKSIGMPADFSAKSHIRGRFGGAN